VGAKTGRDGIHGASLLASAEFTEESQQKRPNVQVGDPFLEKLLLEACLEVMHSGAVVAIQDMGAAGLTCSTCEMASRGGAGIEIDLARVPQRETGMTPYEIMLSESQERMLLVAERGREQEVLRIFAKWGLDAVEIGRVTGDGLLRVLDHGKTVAEIPAHPLAEEGPVYQRPMKPVASRQWLVASDKQTAGSEQLTAGSARPESRRTSHESQITNHESPVTSHQSPVTGAPQDLTENLRRLLASPTIASKRWVYEQYDHMVQTNTMQYPGRADAAVLRVKGTRRALALSVDGNGRWCFLSPREGAKAAVCEAARNVACAGARPLAATNCLNFGSPEKTDVMWQFSEVIDGIAEACTALGTPITGGNVSFYNETLGKSIYPTPVIGILGIIEDQSRTVGMGFRAAGDALVLLDGLSAGGAGAGGRGAGMARPNEVGGMEPPLHFASSEYAKTVLGAAGGAPPAVDLAAEKRLIECLVALAGEGAIASAHDVSDGGIAVTLAESCFASGAAGAPAAALGAEVTLDAAAYVPRDESGGEPAELALFGERGARAVVSCAPESLARVLAIAGQYGVTAREIGAVTEGQFHIRVNGATLVAAPAESLREPWATALDRALGM
jgi:phosphoribosylformylglycinamidine synthase